LISIHMDFEWLDELTVHPVNVSISWIGSERADAVSFIGTTSRDALAHCIHEKSTACTNLP